MPPEPFPHAALDANRAGHLTPDQTVLFRKEAGTDRWNLLFGGLAVGALGAALVFGAVTGRIPGNRVEPLLVGLALLAVGVAVMYFGGIRGSRAKAAAAEAGRVTAVEGPFRRERRDRRDIDGSSHYAPGNEYAYYLFVGDREFDVSQEAYDAAPEDGVVRAYLLGDSNRIVNLERIADAPPPQVPAIVRAAMERAAQSEDPRKAAQAQAMLRQAELMMAGGAAGASPVPAADTARAAVPANPAVPLEEAILGTWRSDLVGISYEFRVDGTALATFAGHASGEVRWTAAGPGTIHLDDSTLQAIVNGDELSLGEPPALLSFHRIG